MTQRTAYFPLRGGLDLVTPAIALPAGRMIGGSNYVPVDTGYQRIGGYERFDGRPTPSAASYWVLNFDAGTAGVLETETVTGGTSGATGIALIDAVLESGTYAGNDADGYLVLTAVSGTFQTNEALTSASGSATSDGTATEKGASNDTDDDTWLQDAIETARGNIAAAAGSGNALGVWSYNGTKYTFRNNAGGTAAVMFKATTAGWVAQDLGETLDFTSGGTYVIAEEDSIEGETGGATATVKRVIIDSGAFADGDAAGRLIIYSQVGAFQAETIKVGANLNVASIAADSNENTLAASGRFEFVNHNFGGHAGSEKMYGCDGVSKAFEWDGSVFVPIITGMTADTPIHIAAHTNHLFLAFSGGSLQHSGTGTPYFWSVITGASELGLGEEITALVAGYAQTLVVFGRNKVKSLYGHDVTDWVLQDISNDSGGVEWTVQIIGDPIYLDDIGLRSLKTTQAFGDFRLGTLSALVEPVFRAKRAAGVTAVASIRVRSKDQYRLFFSDNTGVVLYLGRKQPELGIFEYDDAIECVCSSEDSSGDEEIFFGSDDGFVYQIDSGDSFDAAAVTSFARLPFAHIGAPTQNKRYHKVTLELDAEPGTTLSLIAEFSYGDATQPAAPEQEFDVQGGGGFWDEDNWDSFYWDAAEEGTAEAYIGGIGKNVSIAVRSTETYSTPHTLHGLTIHFSDRGLAR